MKAQDYKISSEKFVFRSHGEKLHDKKLETKPVSYFKDALNRFAKNKASIVATFIIAIIILFAVIAPLCTPYKVADEDKNYAFALPRNEFFYEKGLGFWDGGREVEINQLTHDRYLAIEEEIGRKVIMNEPEIEESVYMKQVTRVYKFRLDTYSSVGAKFIYLTLEEYQRLQGYQDAMGVQVLLPMTDYWKRPQAEQDKKDANIWYETKLGAGGKTDIVYANKKEQTGFKNIYVPYNPEIDPYTSMMRLEGDEALYNYSRKMDGDQYEIRVDYYEYYQYLHYMKGDGITKPSFILGANNAGKDLFVCLSSGARFSLILAVVVATVNLTVGAIYGAIEGYYGGKIDILMERFVEILGSIPFMIVITLLKYHFNVSHILILFISFFLTGWTGMAGRTRMQFYRYKHQEYVLVSRTLGANDRRVMFKHIFPNAIGTLITSSVLVIPGVIFSETSLSYLGIINLSTGSLTSVGTLLATGQSYLFTYPHLILFPAIFISMLMLSFNLFGNGLRDAFNPSLRGTEE